jgi:hypothetical protein
MPVEIPIFVFEPQLTPFERIVAQLKGFEGMPFTPAVQPQLDSIVREVRYFYRDGRLTDAEFNQVWAAIRSVQDMVDDAGRRAGR